eukprot:GHVT01077763.1.p1 GENE.GHVT01077763.1~~GHVT01077763.1.p1  ORF type:complete len:435 (+),score=73.50 GHVT01077763.1:745-2049(+)
MRVERATLEADEVVVADTSAASPDAFSPATTADATATHCALQPSFPLSELLFDSTPFGGLLFKPAEESGLLRSIASLPQRSPSYRFRSSTPLGAKRRLPSRPRSAAVGRADAETAKTVPAVSFNTLLGPTQSTKRINEATYGNAKDETNESDESIEADEPCELATRFATLQPELNKTRIKTNGDLSGMETEESKAFESIAWRKVPTADTESFEPQAELSRKQTLPESANFATQDSTPIIGEKDEMINALEACVSSIARVPGSEVLERKQSMPPLSQQATLENEQETAGGGCGDKQSSVDAIPIHNLQTPTLQIGPIHVIGGSLPTSVTLPPALSPEVQTLHDAANLLKVSPKRDKQNYHKYLGCIHLSNQFKTLMKVSKQNECKEIYRETLKLDNKGNDAFPTPRVIMTIEVACVSFSPPTRSLYTVAAFFYKL